MNKTDNRPLSPHLQIYSLPITARLSILHRISGAALAVLLPLLTIILAALVMGEESWLMIQTFFSHWTGKIVIWATIFALYYHFCNGIRHLVWDFAIHMDKQQMKLSGVIVIISAIILTIMTAMLH